MNYQELTRRELQTLCKQHGLPAKKSNVAMASSLTDLILPKTNSLAPSKLMTPPTAKKSIKARAPLKPERLALAALILASEKPHANAGQRILLKKNKELPEKDHRAESGFVVSLPTNVKGGIPLPRTTPLRRRKKIVDATLPSAAENSTFTDLAQDPEESVKPEVDEIALHASGTLIEERLNVKLSFARDPNVAGLISESLGPRGNQKVARSDGETVVKEEIQCTSSLASAPDTVYSARSQVTTTSSANPEIHDQSTCLRSVQPVLSPFFQCRYANTASHWDAREV